MSVANEKTRFRIFVRDRFRCRYCGKGTEDGIKLTLDHVKPDAGGGTTLEVNLVTACEPCNRGNADMRGVVPPKVAR